MFQRHIQNAAKHVKWSFEWNKLDRDIVNSDSLNIFNIFLILLDL